MKLLITLTAVVVLFSCSNKSEITNRILTLKDSCSIIDHQLDTTKHEATIRMNEVLHPSDAAGMEKVIEDFGSMNDTTVQKTYMKMYVEYAMIRDSLEARKKYFLRQIDSLELELKE